MKKIELQLILRLGTQYDIGTEQFVTIYFKRNNILYFKVDIQQS